MEVKRGMNYIVDLVTAQERERARSLEVWAETVANS